jgi:hypothetical protein
MMPACLTATRAQATFGYARSGGHTASLLRQATR